MTEKRRKRRSPITSIIAILVCFSMLLGTTFAWFTDAVNSVDNIIQAGNLDVELYHTNAYETDEQVLTDTKLFTGANDEPILWEPGVVVWENLTVKNVGTLALQYDLSMLFKDLNYVKGEDGTEYKLSEALSVAVVPNGTTKTTREEVIDEAKNNGLTAMAELSKSDGLEPNQSKTYGIVIYWEPGADDNNWNVNNGKTTTEFAGITLPTNAPLQINLGIELIAKQLMHEEDSFGPDYDQEATMRIIDLNGSNKIDEFTVKEDEHVGVKWNELEINEILKNYGKADIEGGTFKRDGVGVENHGEATFTDVTMNTGSSGDYANILYAGSNTTYNNVEVICPGGGIGAIGGAQVEFNGGSVKIEGSTTNPRYNFYVVGNGTVVTINDGEFDFTPKTLKRAYIYAGEGATVYVNGGTFGTASTHASKSPNYKAGILGDGTVIIKGGTFGFDPTNWVADGYEAVKNGTTWTVSAK